MGAYLPKDRFEEDLILNGRDLIKHTKMDAIKKKMQAMKLEKDNAMDRADACEQQAKDANLRAERAKEEVEALEKKMQQLEHELTQTQTNLDTATHNLEEKEKALQNAEGEVAALNRRIQLLEEDLERSEERLATATQKLAEASHAADESERMRKVLENRSLSDEERMEALENQLKERGSWQRKLTENTTRWPGSSPWSRPTWRGLRREPRPESPRLLSWRRSSELSATT